MHSIIGEEIKTDSIIPVREKKEENKWKIQKTIEPGL